MPSAEDPNITQDAPAPASKQVALKASLHTTIPPPSTSSQEAQPTEPFPALAATPEGEQKLSNAEIKKRAKAEKQAKRAARKVEQGVEVVPAVRPAQEKAPRSATQPQPQQQNQKQSQAIPKEPSTPSTPAHKSQAISGQAQTKEQPPQAEESLPEESEMEKSKRVSLVDHLYMSPRMTTTVNAPEDVHPAVLALGLQMNNYVVCGSSARCVATLLAFKRLIESYMTPEEQALPRHLIALLSPQIEYLVSCRPLCTAQGNAIRWLKVLINGVDVKTPEAVAKADLCQAIDNFIRERIMVAGQVIERTASSMIEDGDTILTFAKSSIITKILLKAHAMGKKFKVIIIDSRPLFEGKNLARTLAKAGLDIKYSLMHAAAHLMKPVNKVFLGAHTMFSNGRLCARVGTAMIAMLAKNLGIPVIVCCESLKFTDRVALDSVATNELLPPEELLLPPRDVPPERSSNNGDGEEGDEDEDGEGGEGRFQSLAHWKELPNLQILNLMHDITPTHYIDMVVTEYGSLPPSSVMTIYRLSSGA